MFSIEALLARLDINDRVKADALAVYQLLADAESHAHGVPVTRVHFHEVGNLDAVADIVGVCMLINELAPDLILSSPIHVGSGYVRCAHGLLPVPAPATAYILRDAPVYSDGLIKGELCTPTGAALLKHFSREFRAMPVIKISGIGYGMGKKDFDKANCVRAFIGETVSRDEAAQNREAEHITDTRETVAELMCNLDDMTPEAVAYAQNLLLDEGALDAYVIPVVMKKSRSGVILACLCRLEDKDRMASLILKHTTSLGVREYICRRYALSRSSSVIDTPLGQARVKTSVGYGVAKSKPEYEDVAEIARKNNMSVQEVLLALSIELQAR